MLLSLAALLFQAQAPVSTQATATQLTLHVVDLNGDGLADQVRSHGDGRLAIALGLGRRQFAIVPQDLPRARTRGLLAADLNSDGNLDLYLLSAGANRVLLGHGDGTFEAVPGELGLGDRGVGVRAELGDLDGDGIADVLLHNESGDALFWGLEFGGFERDPLTPERPASAAATGFALPESPTPDRNGARPLASQPRGEPTTRSTLPPALDRPDAPMPDRPPAGRTSRSLVGAGTIPGPAGSSQLPARLQTPALPQGLVLLWDGLSAPKGFKLLDETVMPIGPSPAWYSKPSVPFATSVPWGGMVGGKFLVCEGQTGSAVRAFDVATQSWQVVPGLSTVISYRGTAAVGGSLYCVGGFSSGSALSRVDVYDAATNTWAPGAPLPTPLQRLGVAAVGGFLYAFGGKGSATGLYADKVYVHFPGTPSWTMLGATLDNPRTVAACAVVGSSVYLFGGVYEDFLGTHSVDYVEVFDSITGTIVKRGLGAPISWQDDAGVFVRGQEVHILGLNNSTGYQVYDTRTDTWFEGAPLPPVPSLTLVGALGSEVYAVERSGTSLVALGPLPQPYHLIRKK